jgi:hypothetical protein
MEGETGRDIQRPEGTNRDRKLYKQAVAVVINVAIPSLLCLTDIANEFG